MTECERFIQTIKKSLGGLLPLHMAEKVAERVTDALIQDGAVFPPVKAGDSVYVIVKDKVVAHPVAKIMLWEDGNVDICYNWRGSGYVCKRESDIGKSVFLNPDEAEKALEQRKEDGNEQRGF